MRLSLVFLVAALAGCGEAVDVGSSAGPLTVAGGATAFGHTFDGYPAYGCGTSDTSNGPCGKFNVYTNDGFNTSFTPISGWFQSEGGYGYQCVELAVRYFWARWRISGWNIAVAADMCSSHPAGVVVTNNPVPGDLMVIGANVCKTTSAGHVAVVDSVTATSVSVTQQNIARNVTWSRACATCFLHATANGGAPPPCGCYSGNGAYCGFEANDYAAAHGCSVGSLAGGHLYSCQNGTWTLKQACTNGCTFNPSGADYCSACAGPVCGSSCCAAGDWCGTNGRCCSGCGTGCPC